MLNSRPETGLTAEGVLAEEVNTTEVTKNEEQDQKPRLKNSKRDRKQGFQSNNLDVVWVFSIPDVCGNH